MPGSTIAEQRGGADVAPACERAKRPPHGVRFASERHQQLGLIPDVQVRCRAQPPDAPPLYSRSRYVWDAREVGSAFGDLGTFLPHVIAAITIVGLAPTGVLVGFGVVYLAAGAVFGVPLAVQPMKAASAAMLVQALTPGEVAGAGLVIGAFFLLAGVSGFITRLTRAVPASVVAGIQVGLGLALAWLGVRILAEQPWLALIVGAVMLAFLNHRRVPAAVAGLVVGITVAALAGDLAALPALDLHLTLPRFALPGWAEVLRGGQLAAIPQIPLTLTNAIIVTAAVTARYFPREVHRVNARSLAISTGIANLLAAPFGGYPMCHGAGGVASHHRFGACTATAPTVIGLTLLALGLLLGRDAAAALALIPAGVIGVLLLFSGAELAWAADVRRFDRRDGALVLVVAAVGLAVNLALAFVLGLALAPLLARLRR